MKKVMLGCMIIGLSTLAYATDPEKKVENFDRAQKKLEKKTIKKFLECEEEMTCIEKTYEQFLEDRDLLVKKLLKVKPKAFRKSAKKTMKKEKLCVLKSKDAKVKKCFQKNDEGIMEAARELVK